MAAMLVDLPPARWVHVSSPRPAVTRPAVTRPAATRPTGRPVGVAAPQVLGRTAVTSSPQRLAQTAEPAPLRLTRRGLAVVMGAFGLVMVTALVVLVTAFLAVPNEPLTQALLG